MRVIILKVAIVLVPSYVVAWISGEMVWVMPTVVASALAATAIKSTGTATRVDDADTSDDASTTDESTETDFTSESSALD
ncbi:MAG: hypothetical protein OXI81_00195 [Paracoccaceae bacterium]|nr:hypothetical protein [Paracoccaceae bacterium]